MWKQLSLVVGLFTLSAAIFNVPLVAVAEREEGAPRSPSEERYIVTFKDGVSATDKDDVLQAHDGATVKELRHGHARVAFLGKEKRAELARDTRVLRVEEDIEVRALARGGTAAAPQALPWGIDRIDAERVWVSSAMPTSGVGIKVAVIDTGISLTHPEFSGKIKGSYNAINPAKSANDDNGHGSHVAGIIAAANNAQGVVGAANGADLYAAKVLNRNGSGWVSDMIEGVDWAIARDVDVINMSVGMPTDVLSLHDAIMRAHDAGIVVVAAAGNDYGGPVNYPAAYPEVIAVSATDNTDTIAYFSSVGPEVDLAAPGASIYSTYKGTGYATFSGTSMAAPHVAGAAALLLSVPAACDSDFNGSCSPDEVRVRLEATAIDRGASGFDNGYGFGIVNIWNALQ